MDRLQEEQNATTTSKPDILEYLAFSTYMQGSNFEELRTHVAHVEGLEPADISKKKTHSYTILAMLLLNANVTARCTNMLFHLYRRLGNVARALSMTNELLELVPTHERALGNRAYYQKEIQSKANQSKKKRGEDGQDDTAIPEQVKCSNHPD